MCCRFALQKSHARTVLARLGVPGAALAAGNEDAEDDSTLPGSRYNIAPGTALLAVRAVGDAPPSGFDLRLAAFSPRWGLIPGWGKTPGNPPPANARAETLAEKPAFRDAFRHRRCVVPVSGFYEWERRGRDRLPWLFRRRDEAPFLFAALHETWRGPDGAAHETCVLVTTAANAVMAPVHHRMPVMLDGDDALRRWLDPRLTEPAHLAPLLVPWPDELTTATRVSTRVNSVRFEGPDCFAPPGPEEDAQLSLAL
ncbi:MAG: SOS response-associated peptidase [Opitutaceae bacterium]|jgi:putative SOS response-associated peptidase YedK|nr:SOS response-associated peptidase [Opitutaceae bacterium]